MGIGTGNYATLGDAYADSLAQSGVTFTDDVASGAAANGANSSDPYSIPWTDEEEKRKRLSDAQIQRDNLLESMGDNPTMEDIVAWGEYDATIKQLTEELGLGPQEYTPGVEGGYIGDGSGGYDGVENVPPIAWPPDNGGSSGLNQGGSTYDPSAAVDYAERGHDVFNSRYYTYDHSDCANFVSQCLCAGGIPMDESWHMYRGEFGGSMRAKLEIAMRLLGNAPISANDNELYAWDATPEWSSADGQFDYFKNSEYAAGTGYFTEDSIESAAKILKPGDIMYFDNNDDGDVNHATIVTDVSDNMVFYGAHTEPRFDQEVTTFFKGYPDGRVYYVSLS